MSPPAGREEQTEVSATIARTTDGQADQQLVRLRAEVETLREQLNHAHRLATVGTMAAMMVHEFNNILTPIISYARMAKSNPALVGKALASAAEGGSRATEICSALLGLTVKEASPRRRVSLARLVGRTLDAMARDPRKDRIDLKVDIPAGLQAATRPVELQQVLLNLLINARTAVIQGKNPRQIEVSASAGKKDITIKVADSGVGIAPENLERVFEPFFTTKPNGDGEGRGLGLAFCRKIVEELGGRIAVRSTLGRGSTFTVCLPK